MTYVEIEAFREGYAPDQVTHTMTVGELIEYLQRFEEELPVYLSHDRGYTFGGLRESRIDETYCDEEDF